MKDLKCSICVWWNTVTVTSVVRKFLPEQQYVATLLALPCLTTECTFQTGCVCLAKLLKRTRLEEASFSRDGKLLSVHLEELVLLALSASTFFPLTTCRAISWRYLKRIYESCSLCLALCLQLWDSVSVRCSHPSSFLFAHEATRSDSTLFNVGDCLWPRQPEGPAKWKHSKIIFFLNQQTTSAFI